MIKDQQTLREYCKARGLPHDEVTLDRYLDLLKRTKKDILRRLKNGQIIIGYKYE